MKSHFCVPTHIKRDLLMASFVHIRKLLHSFSLRKTHLASVVCQYGRKNLLSCSRKEIKRKLDDEIWYLITEETAHFLSLQEAQKTVLHWIISCRFWSATITVVATGNFHFSSKLLNLRLLVQTPLTRWNRRFSTETLKPWPCNQICVWSSDDKNISLHEPSFFFVQNAFL